MSELFTERVALEPFSLCIIFSFFLLIHSFAPGPFGDPVPGMSRVFPVLPRSPEASLPLPVNLFDELAHRVHRQLFERPLFTSLAPMERRGTITRIAFVLHSFGGAFVENYLGVSWGKAFRRFSFPQRSSHGHLRFPLQRNFGGGRCQKRRIGHLLMNTDMMQKQLGNNWGKILKNKTEREIFRSDDCSHDDNTYDKHECNSSQGRRLFRLEEL